MKKIILMAMSVSLCVAADYQKENDMTCMGIIKKIEALEKYKKSSEQGNYEGAERLLLAAMGHFYLGDRREDGAEVDVKKELVKLKLMLPDCNPY